MQVKPDVASERLAQLIVEAALQLDGRGLDAALTTLLILFDEQQGLTARCLAELEAGRYRLDTKLVLALYAACNKEERLKLACSNVTNRLPARAFRQIFNDTFERSDLSSTQRKELSWTLEAFLWRLPAEAPKYESVILGLLRSSQPILRLRALIMVGMLKQLADRDLAIIKKSLGAKSPGLRANALAGLGLMMEHFDDLAPRLQEFLSSDELRALVRQLQRSDPDEAIRANAENLQLALRRGNRSRRRSTPFFTTYSTLSA